MTNDAKNDDRWRRDGDLPYRVLGGEAVLVDPRGREVHVLNDTGTRIWELLAEGHTAAELTRQLAHEFDADPATIAVEVARFIDALAAKGLLVRATPKAA